jgi:hypothetical protein
MKGERNHCSVVAKTDILHNRKRCLLELIMENALEIASADAEEQCTTAPQRGACIEFVQFCKEQHLNSRAAHTFLRLFHNKSWNAECDKIRETMRTEVDDLFGPVEKALKDGANCKEVLALLVKRLKDAEQM